MGDVSSTVRFTPHWTQSFPPHILLPAAVSAVSAAILLIRGEWDTGGMIVFACVFALSPVMALWAEVRRRRTVCEIRGGLVIYRTPSIEKKLRLDRAERTEIRVSPFSRLTGCVKLTLYPDFSRRAWLSVRIPRQSAAAVIDTTAPIGTEIGRIHPGRHSSAIFAVTSDQSALLLITSAYFTLFAKGSRGINALALLTLAAAIIHMLLSFAKHRRLLLSRHQNGCRVTTGFLGGKSIFIPDRAAVGAVVRYSHAGTICGFGSVSLISSGGTEILVACHVGQSEGKDMAFRLLRTAGGTNALLSQPETLKKDASAALAASLFAALIAAFVCIRSESDVVRTLSCVCGAFMFGTAMRCLAGLTNADRSGLRISPSVLCAGGVSVRGSEYCFLRRECVAGMRISSRLLRRMNGLCSAVVFAKGGIRSVKCRCVPVLALDGLVNRFC